ncbi:hypothetical protein [Planotetraspora mira]|nr:hypothetical protein [Planotetraspora mira]
MLFGVVFAAVSRSVFGAVVGALLAFVLVTFRVRRRSLTVHEDGMTAQRDAYRVSVKWADLVEVRRDKLGGLVPLDVMVFSRSELEPVDARGKVRRSVPPKVTEVGADRRIQVGVYLRDWRESPIGRAVAATGFQA